MGDREDRPSVPTWRYCSVFIWNCALLQTDGSVNGGYQKAFTWRFVSARVQEPKEGIYQRSWCAVCWMSGRLSLTLPFCPSEPSYETVSPMLCPPLENCSLSANDCPYGFQQDQNGCLLCQCLSSKSALLPQRWCT